MDNTTNIIYNIKAIDNATAVINSVYQSLALLRQQRNVTIRIKTIYDTKNNITNTVKDVYKASATVNATLKRTLVDTYKQVQTYQTNNITKNKTLNTTLNKTKNTTADVAKKAKEANGHFGGWFVNIGKALSKLISIRRVMDFIVSSVNESANWTENLHLFEVAFDKAAEEGYDFATTISRSFGTSINEVIRYTSTFRQMTDAIGIADATATKMSKTLTALGYDIASLYNLSIESAMEKLEAGIAGQTKPLRTLGMDITAQSLDNYLSQTLKLANVTSKQMTQADKMILRTIVIMEQAQNAYGDMAETINTFSNQVKVLQGATTNFKLAVGDLIKKYFQPVISFFAGVLIAITDIIRAFAPIEDTSGIDNLTNSLMGVDDELNEIAETAGLLSFDKFNALTKNGSNDGINASNITSYLEEVLGVKYEEYMQNFQKAMSSIENDANKIALSIKQWVFPYAEWDEKTGALVGSLGEVNTALKLLWHTLKLIVAIGTTVMLTKIPGLLEKVCLGIVNATSAAKAMDATLSAFAWVIFIKGLMDTIENWDKMSTAGKIASAVFVAIAGAIAIYTTALYLHNIKMGETIAITWLYIKDALVALIASVKKVAVAILTKMVVALKAIGTTITTTVIPALLQMMATTSGLIVGIAALGAGIGYFISNLDKMSTAAKIIIPIIATLSAVFVGLAVAKAAAAAGIGAPVMAGITAAALTAAIVLAAGTAIAVKSYATGGLPDKGQLFIANENGNPELVGNIGGNTSVANNDMIVQAIENAAYRGFIRAIDTTGTGRSGSGNSQPIVLNVNGRELARAVAPDMADEFNRRNVKIK